MAYRSYITHITHSENEKNLQSNILGPVPTSGHVNHIGVLYENSNVLLTYQWLLENKLKITMKL